MSFREEQNGKFYFPHKTTSKLILPDEPLKEVFEANKLEKEQEEAAEILFELEKKKQEEIDAKLEKLEMIPLGNKVVILPYPQNPYRKIVQGNIIVEYNGDFRNPDSGEKDTLKELVGCAKVIEVGPECKFLKNGDDVYYMPNTAYPLPFMSCGYKLTTEPQILCAVGEDLKNRFNK